MLTCSQYRSPRREALAKYQGQTCICGSTEDRLAIERQTGSHRVLSREGWRDYVFAFHDNDELGPRILARIAIDTGLRPEDL